VGEGTATMGSPSGLRHAITQTQYFQGISRVNLLRICIQNYTLNERIRITKQFSFETMPCMDTTENVKNVHGHSYKLSVYYWDAYWQQK
jgi:hypothetical protein